MKEVIFQFNILWCGWESDYEARVIKEHDKTKLEVCYNNDWIERNDPNFLKDKLREYEKIVNDTKFAISLLEKNTDR